MLIAARDHVDGSAGLFWLEEIDDLEADQRGRWFIQWGGGRECLVRGPSAEPFCRNIPPGEKRVIDLEKSTIVHVATPKTPVEELVEATEGLIELLDKRSKEYGGRFLFKSHTRIEQYEAACDSICAALARVRQEGWA